MLSSKSPIYLANDAHFGSESFAYFLMSFLKWKCSVTHVHSGFGDRWQVTSAEPHIWNSLPASLWDKEVRCTELKRQMKTFMFQMDCGTLWLFDYSHFINMLTYLLTYLHNHLHRSLGMDSCRATKSSYVLHYQQRCGWTCNQFTSKVDGGITRSRLRLSVLT